VSGRGFTYSSKACKKIESIRKSSFAKSLAIAELYPDYIEMTDDRQRKIKRGF
jgi:hypothetical protein